MALYTASILTEQELYKDIKRIYRKEPNLLSAALFTINVNEQDFDGYDVSASEYFENVYKIKDSWLVPTIIGIYREGRIQSFATDRFFTEKDKRGNIVDFFDIVVTPYTDFININGDVNESFEKEIGNPFGDCVIKLYEFYEDYDERQKSPRTLINQYINYL